MKNLIIAFLLFVSTVLSAQNYYCVQIMSTQNPQLLTKEHVEFTGDPAFFEMVIINNITYYRVMLVYTDEIAARITLDLVMGAGYQYSLICIRTKEQIAKMIPVFTHNMVNPDNQ
jgi:hypothetical protein